MDSLSQLQRLLEDQEHRPEGSTEELTSLLVRTGFRHLVEEMLEAEVTEFLGRDP